MHSSFKVTVAAVTVLAVIVACATSQPEPSTGAASPGVLTPSPLVTPAPSSGSNRLVVAGTDLGGPRLELTATIPAGWVAQPFAAYPQATGSVPPAGAGFFVSVIDDTFTDPCSHTSQRSPKIGSTVADAATALGQIPHTTATKPVQTTIAGHAATYLELTIPSSLPCAPNDFYLWQDSPNGHWWVEGLNETLHVWLVDVSGQRVALTTRSWPGTTAATKAELQGLLDSIVFATAPGPS